MADKNRGKPLREGYQPSDRLGHQPPRIEKKGYQPTGSTRPVAQNPPSGGSNVKPPSK